MKTSHEIVSSYRSTNYILFMLVNLAQQQNVNDMKRSERFSEL